MVIKNKSKLAFTAIALFVAAFTFSACNNGETAKTETPAVDSPKTMAPVDTPMKPTVIDTEMLKGNGKPTPEKPAPAPAQ